MEKARPAKKSLVYHAVAEVNQSSVCGMNRKLDLTRTELQWTWGGRRFKGSVNGGDTELGSGEAGRRGRYMSELQEGGLLQETLRAMTWKVGRNLP